MTDEKTLIDEIEHKVDNLSDIEVKKEINY